MSGIVNKPPKITEREWLFAMSGVCSHQANPRVHPLTCGNDSGHKPLIPIWVGTRVNLLCVDCGYVQENLSIYEPGRSGW